MHGGKEYMLCGINPNSPKYCILAIDLQNNKEYNFPIGAVKNGKLK